MTPIGVLLMTYGSPSDAEELRAYLRSAHGGREPSLELVTEFLRRYQLVGWSPLIRITREQGAALQALLDATAGPGRHMVEVGIAYHRIELPNTQSAFIRALAAVVRRESAR